jgi:hypothetical protein
MKKKQQQLIVAQVERLRKMVMTVIVIMMTKSCQKNVIYTWSKYLGTFPVSQVEALLHRSNPSSFQGQAAKATSHTDVISVANTSSIHLDVILK